MLRSLLLSAATFSLRNVKEREREKDIYIYIYIVEQEKGKVGQHRGEILRSLLLPAAAVSTRKAGENAPKKSK